MYQVCDSANINKTFMYVEGSALARLSPKIAFEHMCDYVIDAIWSEYGRITKLSEIESKFLQLMYVEHDGVHSFKDEKDVYASLGIKKIDELKPEMFGSSIFGKVASLHDDISSFLFHKRAGYSGWERGLNDYYAAAYNSYAQFLSSTNSSITQWNSELVGVSGDKKMRADHLNYLLNTLPNIIQALTKEVMFILMVDKPMKNLESSLNLSPEVKKNFNSAVDALRASNDSLSVSYNLLELSKFASDEICNRVLRIKNVCAD
jgi:hypothetical protein